MTRLLNLRIAMIVAALALLAGLCTIDELGAGSPSSASAASPAQRIGLRVLLITDSTNVNSMTAYQDWVNTLGREGVPYTAVVANGAAPESVPLPTLSSTLPDGTQVANYEGVVVATSGAEGLSTQQWAALQSFEHQFSVRQLTAYAVPSADLGLSAANPAGGAALAPTTPLALTADGHKVFPYLNQFAVDPTQATWSYQATALPGPKVTTLISGPGNSSLLGVYTSADGRETMYQTFNQNQYYLQSQLLGHGELAWLARNTYFGDQRNYLETHIDDVFLGDDAWSTATHTTDFNPSTALRAVPADVTTAATWSRANNFRIDMLFNGGGSVTTANGSSLTGTGDTGSGTTGSTGGPPGTATGQDPLLAAFQATDPGRPQAVHERLRLAQPHLGPPQHRPGLRDRTTSRPRSSRTPTGPASHRHQEATRPRAGSGSPRRPTPRSPSGPRTRAPSSPASTRGWPTSSRATRARSTRRPSAR